MMGGMWSYKSGFNRDLSKLIYKKLTNTNTAKKYNTDKLSDYEGDQAFLSAVVWPYSRRNSTIHDSYYCHILGGQPFPTQRLNNHCYVGCYGRCCHVNTTMLMQPCSYRCRPSEHKDWVFC